MDLSVSIDHRDSWYVLLGSFTTLKEKVQIQMCFLKWNNIITVPNSMLECKRRDVMILHSSSGANIIQGESVGTSTIFLTQQMFDSRYHGLTEIRLIFVTGTTDSHARFHYNLQRKTMLRQRLESKRSVMGYKSSSSIRHSDAEQSSHMGELTGGHSMLQADPPLYSSKLSLLTDSDAAISFQI
ncbi:hypothetical protein MUK42_12724 [Musa troglodytarum]|uniref:Uncharacterized protein n=1 Tax=Musa troglodytarum TaxID=320322 RepID=A0A9E7L8Z3_9LILI|nr:hypothetical protein MUK42_12724 [Musa troglodytarum]